MSVLVTAARSPLRTEADIVRTLANGTYRLEDIYRRVGREADVSRDGGMDRVHHGDRRWMRRCRCALQALRARGEAEALGKTVWLVDRPVARARRMVLVSLGGTLAEIELRVQDAVELLRSLEEPADLVLCDPPWGLDRRSDDDLVNGQGRVYRRDQSRVVGGYVDVPSEVYGEFVRGWVSAAAAALRPGGQLAVVTGPEKAAVHQVAAESAGLAWVQTIVARREFSLYARRRVSAAHWTITVMVTGPVGSRRRVFHAPRDLPRSRAGGLYPTSVWLDNGRADRHQVMRYDNALPLPLVRRIVEMLTDPGELVIDPAVGSGTTAIACWQSGRRCVAGDINAQAVQFAAARLLAEHCWPRERQPALFAD